MIQWSLAPMPSSGSKWNTIRCSQYSVRVQKRYPPSTHTGVSQPDPWITPSTTRNTIVGPNRSGGIAGCTRESRSSRSDSNIRGEARSASLRLSPSRSSASWVAIGLTIPPRHHAVTVRDRSVNRTIAAGSSVLVHRLGPVHRNRQQDVPKRECDERALLRGSAAVERSYLDLGEREEHPLGGVEVVGEPASVPVARQAQDAGDPVAVGFDQ